MRQRNQMVGEFYRLKLDFNTKLTAFRASRDAFRAGMSPEQSEPDADDTPWTITFMNGIIFR